MLDPRVLRGGDDDWDGVALDRIVTCERCGALDAYAVLESSYQELVREANAPMGG